MSAVKVMNNRGGGNLYHYAHFICDCLFPEILQNIQNYNTVYRIKDLRQTLGNFNKKYQNIMQNKSIELSENDFNNLNVDIIQLKTRRDYTNIESFTIFRNYIFNRFNIQPNISYPEIILIKRGKQELISDAYLKTLNPVESTGFERREIYDIAQVEMYLHDKYLAKFKAVYLEEHSFEEQVKLFHNANMIVCAHGAAMSNMFFCEKGTTIIEVVCEKKWGFFDSMSSILELKHIKVIDNTPSQVISAIQSCPM